MIDNPLSVRPEIWWSRAGTIRRPPRCQRGALPTELRPQNWWKWRGFNPRPPACKAGALATELHPQSGRRWRALGAGCVANPFIDMRVSASGQTPHRHGWNPQNFPKGVLLRQRRYSVLLTQVNPCRLPDPAFYSGPRTCFMPSVIRVALREPRHINTEFGPAPHPISSVSRRDRCRSKHGRCHSLKLAASKPTA